jgi:hypothetical protein
MNRSEDDGEDDQGQDQEFGKFDIHDGVPGDEETWD